MTEHRQRIKIKKHFVSRTRKIEELAALGFMQYTKFTFDECKQWDEKTRSRQFYYRIIQMKIAFVWMSSCTNERRTTRRRKAKRGKSENWIIRLGIHKFFIIFSFCERNCREREANPASTIDRRKTFVENKLNVFLDADYQCLSVSISDKLSERFRFT